MAYRRDVFKFYDSFVKKFRLLVKSNSQVFEFF